MFLKPYLFLIFTCVYSFAGITWEDVSLKNNASTTDDHTLGVFRFKNDGASPVTIKSVDTTCDCIAIDAPKKAFAPGESGEVKVTFLVKGRIGLQRKTVDVVTDDAENPKTTLTLTTLISQPVQIAPTVLLWKTGTDKKTQTLHITVTTEQGIRFTQPECSESGWELQLRTIKEGKEYALDATPSDTSKPQAALVKLNTDSDQDLNLTARLRVQ